MVRTSLSFIQVLVHMPLSQVVLNSSTRSFVPGNADKFPSVYDVLYSSNPKRRATSTRRWFLTRQVIAWSMDCCWHCSTSQQLGPVLILTLTSCSTWKFLLYVLLHGAVSFLPIRLVVFSSTCWLSWSSWWAILVRSWESWFQAILAAYRRSYEQPHLMWQPRIIQCHGLTRRRAKGPYAWMKASERLSFEKKYNISEIYCT